MKLYDLLRKNYVEADYDLSDIFIKFKSIPKDQNAKMVFDDFEVTIGIEEKIPLFTITNDEKTLVTGVLVVDDYIKNKVIKKMIEQVYSEEIIEDYKNVSIDTIVFISEENNAVEYIDMFLEVLKGIEIR